MEVICRFGQLESQDLGSYLAYLKEGDTVPVKVVVEEAKDGFPVVSMRLSLKRESGIFLRRSTKMKKRLK